MGTKAEGTEASIKDVNVSALKMEYAPPRGKRRIRVDKVWHENGDVFRLKDLSKQQPKLENAVYTLEIDVFGFFLEKKEEFFSFDYKLYGLETSLVKRAIKTYGATKGNLGMLFNGVKGTGKTVTAKIICNELKMPIILVSHFIEGSHFFLNSIPQDITIFIDEYEKVFGEEADMLTIMDGALNSDFRRAFMLTTNKLYINENLLQRPGRIRYLKTFGDLQAEIVEEIIDDRLIHKKFKNDCVKFISNLELITVDIVNSIIDEVNIHNEETANFKDVFNVKKITGKFNISIVDEQGNLTEFKKGSVISPRKIDVEEDQILGNYFYAGNDNLGQIIEVIDYCTIKVESREEDGKKLLKRKRVTAVSTDVKISGEPTPKEKAVKPKITIKHTIYRVESADTVNWKYRQSYTGDYTHLM